MYPPAKESDGGRLRGCGRSRWAPPTVCPPQRASSPIHGASRPPPPLPRATRRRGGVRAPAHATRPKAAVGPVGPGSAWASHRRHQRLHERGAPPAPSFPRASVPSTGCCQCRHRRARGMSSQRGGGCGVRKASRRRPSRRLPTARTGRGRRRAGAGPWARGRSARRARARAAGRPWARGGRRAGGAGARAVGRPPPPLPPPRHRMRASPRITVGGRTSQGGGATPTGWPPPPVLLSHASPCRHLPPLHAYRGGRAHRRRRYSGVDDAVLSAGAPRHSRSEPTREGGRVCPRQGDL